MRLLILGLVVLCSCGGTQEPRAAPTPCPAPSPTTGTQAFLKEFPLTDWGVLTAVESQGKYATATLTSSQSVIELHPQIARAVIDGRFTIIGADNEGFESEIYFSRHGRFYGAFRLRQGTCPKQVTVRLLYIRKPGAATDIPSMGSTASPSI